MVLKILEVLRTRTPSRYVKDRRYFSDIMSTFGTIVGHFKYLEYSEDIFKDTICLRMRKRIEYGKSPRGLELGK